MKGMKELLVGVILAVLGVAGIWYFLGEVITVIKGVIPIFVLLVGAVFLMIGVSTMREKSVELGECETGSEKEESET
ncbi:MAG: hypothetical protein EFT35_02160 [Methanophagales archaeon ANME-1-THS]|nr:MAG: hypothetical protein EFT35_02160 [Methanophagales archaeon ANME-1-THS]